MTFKIHTVALCAALVTAPSVIGPAVAGGLADDVVGTWQLVSLTVINGDKRIELFGPNPRGIQMMGADGRFANIITRETLPLYASGNRMQGSEEEYRTIAQGSNGFFGTYTVDEAAGEVIFQIDTSIFPNWEGVTQRRVSTIDDGVWRYVNPMTAIGQGQVEVVWERFD